MAPDAEKYKLRHQHVGNEEVNGLESEVDCLDDLSGDEVAIDGTVYSLKDFKHPGGDQIKLFGGNDVTVQYKMIHPHHTSHHLTKMTIVRKLKNYTCEYQFDTPFERELKQEVFKIVKRGKEFGTPGYFARVALYVGMYFTCLYFWMFHQSSYFLAAVFGVSHALIGLNVQHDANHGAASRKPFINDLLGFGVDLIGGSKWLWMEQHWTHHAYTNHQDKDPDAFSAEPMIILNEYPVSHPKRRWYHKFQIIWTVPLLSLYWLSIVSSTDIIALKHPGATSVGMKLDNDFVKQRAKYAITSRVIYLMTVVVPPFYQHGTSLLALLHVLFMGCFGSLVLSLLFLISHNFESVERDPTAESRIHGNSVCWYKCQVETSSTYGGFISGCLTGGLNFQIEHHLFPRMSSAWYPTIAPTVRKVCAKHGIKYTYYPWIWHNLIATAKHIHYTGMASTTSAKKDD